MDRENHPDAQSAADRRRESQRDNYLRGWLALGLSQEDAEEQADREMESADAVRKTAGINPVHAAAYAADAVRLRVAAQEHQDAIAVARQEAQRQVAEERRVPSHVWKRNRVGEMRVRPAEDEDDQETIYTCTAMTDNSVTAMTDDGIGCFTWAQWDSMKEHVAVLSPNSFSDQAITTVKLTNPLLCEINEVGGAALYDEYKRIHGQYGRVIEHWTHLHHEEQQVWETLASKLMVVPR